MEKLNYVIFSRNMLGGLTRLEDVQGDDALIEFMRGKLPHNYTVIQGEQVNINVVHEINKSEKERIFFRHSQGSVFDEKNYQGAV